jgi:hypothetical protein
MVPELRAVTLSLTPWIGRYLSIVVVQCYELVSTSRRRVTAETIGRISTTARRLEPRVDAWVKEQNEMTIGRALVHLAGPGRDDSQSQVAMR